MIHQSCVHNPLVSSDKEEEKENIIRQSSFSKTFVRNYKTASAAFRLVPLIKQTSDTFFKCSLPVFF